jgi:2-C-methyl-D-erythritol 2,4-cyclodiphosphate synthase
MSLRIGIGHDVHAFADAGSGRRLVLGGVVVPYAQGLAGHSDADVLAHAVADALLGAARLGDIGLHFPDDDAAFADADSMRLLSVTAQMLTGLGLKVLDVDCVLSAERPRLSEYRQPMRERLASAIGIEPAQVGVKATTYEGLGFIGRGEGIAAMAVALLVQVEAEEGQHVRASA